MSAEFIGIPSVGVALGGSVLALQLRTDRRLENLEGRIGALEKRFVEKLAASRGELRALGRRVARLKGLIEVSGLFRRAELSEGAGD